mmetsp:Transcript_16313/g.38547  ORF Transcript_16313/g.38547 Transcript_16313/m.38547 type:complete len:88 (+) Transcript_16313:221-484(+)
MGPLHPTEQREKVRAHAAIGLLGLPRTLDGEMGRRTRGRILLRNWKPIRCREEGWTPLNVRLSFSVPQLSLQSVKENTETTTLVPGL